LYELALRLLGGAVFLADADDHIDPLDRGALGWPRQFADPDKLARDILQVPGRLAEEVMMVVDVCIEIGAARLDDDLAHEPRRRELVQRVVDGRKRDPDRGGEGLAMQLLGRRVPVAALEQEPRQGDPLSRRPEAGAAQALDDGGRRAFQLHDLRYRP